VTTLVVSVFLIQIFIVSSILTGNVTYMIHMVLLKVRI